jgi:pyruvate formate-lyase activating enzyme-like uncharacterized protein
LKNRWIRRANNIRKDYEIVDDDGLLVKGVIETKNPYVKLKELMKKYKIKNNLAEIRNGKIETTVSLTEKISRKEKDLKCFIVKEIPIEKTWEVERWPL